MSNSETRKKLNSLKMEAAAEIGEPSELQVGLGQLVTRAGVFGIELNHVSVFDQRLIKFSLLEVLVAALQVFRFLFFRGAGASRQEQQCADHHKSKEAALSGETS